MWRFLLICSAFFQVIACDTDPVSGEAIFGNTGNGAAIGRLVEDASDPASDLPGKEIDHVEVPRPKVWRDGEVIYDFQQTPPNVMLSDRICVDEAVAILFEYDPRAAKYIHMFLYTGSNDGDPAAGCPTNGYRFFRHLGSPGFPSMPAEDFRLTVFLKVNVDGERCAMAHDGLVELTFDASRDEHTYSHLDGDEPTPKGLLDGCFGRRCATKFDAQGIKQNLLAACSRPAQLPILGNFSDTTISIEMVRFKMTARSPRP